MSRLIFGHDLTWYKMNFSPLAALKTNTYILKYD